MDGKFVEQKKQKELDYQRKNDRIRMEEHSGTEILGSKKIENDKIKYREYTQKESHTAHDTIQNDIVSRKDCKSDAIQGTTENQPSEKTMHVLKMNEVHEVHIPPKHEIQKESNNLQEKGALVNEKLEDLAKILDCYEGFVNANKDKKDNSEIFSKFCSSFVALSNKIRDLSASAADISEAYKNMIEATSIYFNKNNKFKWSSKGRKRRDITGDILNKCKGLDDSIFAFETAHAIEEENDNTNNENSDLEATVQENNTEEIKEETNKNEQAIKDEETINVINDEAGQDMIENEEKAPEELTFEVSEDTINDLVGGILKKEDKKTFFKGGTRSFVLGGRYLKIAGDITKKLLRRKIDNSNLKSEEDYKKLDLENVARGSFMKLNDIFDANKKMLDTYMANGFAGKCQDKNLKNALAISGYREKLMDKIMESIGENMFLETSKAKEGVENKDDLFFDTFIESYNMEEDSLRDKNYENNVTYFMEQLEKTMPKGWDMPKFFENKVINFIVSTTDYKDIEKSFEGFKNQLDENIKTIKEQLGKKISPFSRDKVMKSLMENIDYRLLIFNAHAISDYTADYCHNLMAKNIEAGVIENKLNYYIRKYNIPQKYSRIAKEHLFEDIKTKDINPENLDMEKDANAIKSILEKYGRSVTENEALFNDSMDLELSDNEWKEVFKEKKSAIFSDKKEFEKWINETKNQYKERTIENHEKYYKLDSILYKMRKKGEPEIQEKEDNTSVESIKDMLEGSLFLGSCVYDDYLEVNSTDTKTKEENNKKDEKAQKLLEEKEKLKIKNNKDFVLNTIMSLINEGKYKDKFGIPADIKTWDELSTLAKSKQQEFVAFLDHNLGSNVERLMNLPVTYRSRLKEDCLKEVLLGNISNDNDFEAKIKEFTKQYAKDDKFDEKRLDIRLRGKLEFNKDVKYDYMRVQGSDRSILGFFSMPGSNVYKQSDRARHIKQAGRAWELIKNKNLYMETCSLIQLLQNELLDKKNADIKEKIIEDFATYMGFKYKEKSKNEKENVESKKKAALDGLEKKLKEETAELQNEKKQITQKKEALNARIKKLEDVKSSIDNLRSSLKKTYIDKLGDKYDEEKLGSFEKYYDSLVQNYIASFQGKTSENKDKNSNNDEDIISYIKNYLKGCFGENASVKKGGLITFLFGSSIEQNTTDNLRKIYNEIKIIYSDEEISEKGFDVSSALKSLGEEISSLNNELVIVDKDLNGIVSAIENKDKSNSLIKKNLEAKWDLKKYYTLEDFEKEGEEFDAYNEKLKANDRQYKFYFSKDFGDINKLYEIRDVFLQVAKEKWPNGDCPELRDYIYEFLCGGGANILFSHEGQLEKLFYSDIDTDIKKGDTVTEGYKDSLLRAGKVINDRNLAIVNMFKRIEEEDGADKKLINKIKNAFFKKMEGIVADLEPIYGEKITKEQEERNLKKCGVRSLDELIKIINNYTVEDIIEIAGDDKQINNNGSASEKQMEYELYERRTGLLTSKAEGAAISLLLPYMNRDKTFFYNTMTLNDEDFEKYANTVLENLKPFIDTMNSPDFKAGGYVNELFVMKNHDRILENALNDEKIVTKEQNKEQNEEKNKKQIIEKNRWRKELNEFTDNFMNYAPNGRKSIKERLDKLEGDDKLLHMELQEIFTYNPELMQNLFREELLRNTLRDFQINASANLTFMKCYRGYIELERHEKALADQFFHQYVGVLGEKEFQLKFDDLWKEFSDVNKKTVLTKTDRRVLDERTKTIQSLRQIKYQGENSEKVTGIRQDMARLQKQRYKCCSPIIAAFGLKEESTSDYSKKANDAKDDAIKVVNSHLLKDEKLIVYSNDVPSVIYRILADQNMSSKKIKEDDMKKRADWLNNLWKSLQKKMENKEWTEGENNKSIISRDNIEKIVVKLYINESKRDYKDIKESFNNIDDSTIERETREFYESLKLYEDYSASNYEDNNLAIEYRNSIDSIGMGLFTEEPEKLKSIMTQEKEYFDSYNIAIKEIDKCFTDYRKKTGLEGDRLKTGLVEFVKIFLRNHPLVPSRDANENLEKNKTEFEKILKDAFGEDSLGDNFRRFLVDSNSVMGQIAYDDESYHEKTGISYSRKDCEKLIESKVEGGLYDDRTTHKFNQYMQLTIEERKLFFAYLSLPETGFAGENSQLYNMVRNKEKDRKETDIFKKAIEGYVEKGVFDPPIDYDRVMQRISRGKKGDDLSNTMFTKAMTFVESIKNAIENKKEPDYDFMGNGSMMHEKAILFVKGKNPANPPEKLYADAKKTMENEKSMDGFFSAFNNVAETDVKNTSTISKLINYKDNINILNLEITTPSAICEKISGFSDYEKKIFIGVLQNRTALDNADNEMVEKGANDYDFVNEELRSKLIDKYTDDSALLNTTVTAEMMENAMDTLFSYQLKTTVERGKSLTGEDFVNISRGTVFDWKLLRNALELVEEISRKRDKINLVRNSSSLLENNRSNNKKAQEAYNKYMEQKKTDNKPLSQERFDEILYENMTTDLSFDQEKISDMMAGYAALTEDEKKLFFRALEHRDILDVSKEDFLSSYLGQTERDYVNPKERDDLINDFLENSMREKSSIKFYEDSRDKALVSLLSSQIDDSVKTEKIKNIGDAMASEKFFGTRNTAIDWKLFGRALQLVKRTSNERNILRGSMEIYRTQGNLKETGSFSYNSSYMRNNLHNSGSRWNRYFSRRAIKVAEELGANASDILSYVDLSTKRKLAKMNMFEQEEDNQEDVGYDEKAREHIDSVDDYWGAYSEGSLLTSNTYLGFASKLMKSRLPDYMENSEAGEKVANIKNMVGSAAGYMGTAIGIIDKELPESVTGNIVGGKIEFIQKNIGDFVHGLDGSSNEDFLEKHGSKVDMGLTLLKEASNVVSSIISIKNSLESKEELVKSEQNIQQLGENHSEDVLKNASENHSQTEAEKKLSKETTERRMFLLELSKYYGNKAVNEEIRTHAFGLVRSFYEDSNILEKMGLDVDNMGGIESYCLKHIGTILEEAGSLINFICRIHTDNELLKQYYSEYIGQDNIKVKGPFYDEIEKLRDNYRKNNSLNDTEGKRLSTENKDLAENAYGFEGFDEHVSYVSFNLVNAILMGCSKQSGGDQKIILTSRAILAMLDMSEYIGRTDDEAAMKLYEKITGKEYK